MRSSSLSLIRQQLDVDTADVPRENVERHFHNLERLAASLRALGLNEQQIDVGVMDVFRQYQQRLAEYLAAVQQAREHD